MFEKIIKPKRLEKGDTIGIISPSGSAAYNKKMFNAGLKVIKKLGFDYKLGKNVYAELDEHKNNYSAGTVEQRIEDLHWVFEDKEVDAIICSTGGVTANQLLRHIDYNIIKKNPKIFSGMSDITTLENPIFAKTGLVTFHGPIVMFMWEFAKEQELFLNAVKPEPLGQIKPFKPNTWQTIKPGKTSGRLVGGNFNTVAKLLGTEFEPDWRNKILLLEAFQMKSESVEDVMSDYANHGVYDKISGMIIGHLDGYDNKPDIATVVKRVTEGYNFPILKIDEFGHNCKNITIPIGVKATVDATNKTFSIDESAVI
jgi:muramoyltetrapeptide carboxypeptidase